MKISSQIVAIVVLWGIFAGLAHAAPPTTVTCNNSGVTASCVHPSSGAVTTMACPTTNYTCPVGELLCYCTCVGTSQSDCVHATYNYCSGGPPLMDFSGFDDATE